ncbi:MAG: L-lysine 6-transaminase [Candidatus Paceibacteria bacterium]|jgi:L-lysine 6-transaminase
MIDPKNVHSTLERAQLADGYPIVLDLEKSKGVYMHDSRTGEDYLDLFTHFASWPVGYDHPMMSDPAFLSELMTAAKTKVANSDLYTRQMADFVEAFSTRVTPDNYPYHFWVSGGSLAVENALKVAFDWKARKVGVDKVNDGKDLVALHFKGAFHGRSGYTMSLTNTDPNKVALFPKFDWPRISTPALEFDNEGQVCNDVEALEKKSLAEIDAAFQQYSGRIACMIIEPLQGEGGDNHFRTEFLTALRKIADEREALLIFDEVQTGFYGSGKAWLWQHHGVEPDVVCFGKKTQVCGIYANTRIDDVEDNTFHKSSRINSTWGGNLVDMVRCRRFIDIIAEEKLAENASVRGAEFVTGLRHIAKDRGQISNVRGIGSLVAFTLESAVARDKMLAELFENKVMALSSGEKAVRFRLPLVISAAEIELALTRIADCLPAARTQA